MSIKLASGRHRSPDAPETLRGVAQWVLWRYESRDGHRTKVPISPFDGRRASTKDPSTWTTWEHASLALGTFTDCEGIGFVFTVSDPFCGIDLDDCLTESGEPEPWAKEILERLATYSEVSPSGRGVKLFLRGKLPPGGRRKGKIEMYDSGRYFTVTGRQLPGTLTAVEERQAEVKALHTEIFGSPALRRSGPAIAVRPPAEDAALLVKARSAKNGRKFMDLFYRGDLSAYRGDDSAADLALCGLLAFWCGADGERIDRLFRQSALMREKWDSRRSGTTYGALTIGRALGG
jgi:primase-polymerase (primpol)-like protein